MDGLSAQVMWQCFQEVSTYWGPPGPVFRGWFKGTVGDASCRSEEGAGLEKHM